MTVTVGAPDLVVDAPTFSTSSPTYGTHFILPVTVRNQGNGRAGITTLRWYLSTDATICASDTEVGSQTVWGVAGFGNQRPFNRPARPLERRHLLLRRLRGERQRGKQYREQLLPSRNRRRTCPGSRRRCPYGRQQQPDRRGLPSGCTRQSAQPGQPASPQPLPCASTARPTGRSLPAIPRWDPAPCLSYGARWKCRCIKTIDRDCSLEAPALTTTGPASRASPTNPIPGTTAPQP